MGVWIPIAYLFQNIDLQKKKPKKKILQLLIFLDTEQVGGYASHMNSTTD